MPPSSWEFDAIGTHWQIDTTAPLAHTPRQHVSALISEFDAVWSRFRDDSLVAAVAAESGRHRFPDDAIPMIALYDSLVRLTDGAMSPLVGGPLSALGYGSGYALRTAGEAAPAPEWTAVSWQGPVLATDVPVELDVGAAGKGRLVDLVLDSLVADRLGADEVTIDASGDLRHSGGEPLRVALEHPYDPAIAVGTVELGDGALCASATNRRVWGDGLHHVIDARTGRPVTEIAATWVTASTAMVADALATALFFTGPERLAGEFEFEYVRFTTDGVAQWSPGWNGEVFT